MVDKKGAIELSVGTIVIIVLSVTLLILGIVFVKSIMCSGIVISEQLSTGVKNEVNNLFGADQYGVRCVGEGGQEIKYASGGRRQIVCIIKSESQATYNLKVTDVKSLIGASTSTVQKWILQQDWKGDVSPGGNGQDAVVLVLNIPSDAPTTTLSITISAENVGSGSKTTHTSIIDITPSGFLQTTLC